MGRCGSQLKQDKTSVPKRFCRRSVRKFFSRKRRFLCRGKSRESEPSYHMYYSLRQHATMHLLSNLKGGAMHPYHSGSTDIQKTTKFRSSVSTRSIFCDFSHLMIQLNAVSTPPEILRKKNG